MVKPEDQSVEFVSALDLKKGRVVLARVESLSNDLTQILYRLA
jgi:hypothetical protein